MKYNQTDLEKILEFTRFVAVQQTDEASAQEAELSAKAYADARNTGKKFYSDFGFSNEDKSIVDSTKEWFRKQRNRGHYKPKKGKKMDV
jgi:hypothetical protein